MKKILLLLSFLTFIANAQIDSQLPDYLCTLKINHYGFDNKIHQGELIVNCEIKEDVKEIFEELLEAKYKIEKIKPISNYNNDDNLSMEDNNTSAYNYRKSTNSNKLSKHALGLAIDIDPLYNPYIKEKSIKPINAKNTDRSDPCPHCIKKGDACYNAFIKRGFRWGGEWRTLKDYQHFEK